MAYIQPKTNWEPNDYLTHTDYNRIKNNLKYINDLFNASFPEPFTFEPGADMAIDQFFRASTWNMFEDCVEHFQRCGVIYTFGDKSTYKDNGPLPNYMQLNRLEKCIEAYYGYDIAVTDVTVNPLSKVIFVHNTDLPLIHYDKYEAVIIPSNAFNKNVTWASSDTNKATIDNDGYFTAKQGGEVSFTVTTEDGNFTKTVPLYTVIYVESAAINESLSVVESETLNVAPLISHSPASANYIRYEYESTNTSVFTVNSSGVITGVHEGNASLKVKIIQGTNGVEEQTYLITKAVEVTQHIIAVTGVAIDPPAGWEYATYWEDLPETNALGYTAIITPSDATNQNVTWSSSDTTVATINSNGRCSLKKKGGNSMITVTTADGGYTATAPLDVVIMAETMSIASLTVESGQTLNVIPKITVSPTQANYRNYNFTSSDTSVFTVDANGVITGVSVGSATLTVQLKQGTNPSSPGHQVTVTKAVNVTAAQIHVTGISMTSSASAYVGTTYQLTPNISPSNATNKSVTWSSSNTNYATVDQNGLVTIKSTAPEGQTVVITATTVDGGYTASCTITIKMASQGSYISNSNTKYATRLILISKTEDNKLTFVMKNCTSVYASGTGYNVYVFAPYEDYETDVIPKLLVYLNRKEMSGVYYSSYFYVKFCSNYFTKYVPTYHTGENPVYTQCSAPCFPISSKEMNISTEYDCQYDTTYQYFIDNPSARITGDVYRSYNTTYATRTMYTASGGTETLYKNTKGINSSGNSVNISSGTSNFNNVRLMFRCDSDLRVLPNQLNDGSYAIDWENKSGSILVSSLPIGTTICDVPQSAYNQGTWTWS